MLLIIALVCLTAIITYDVTRSNAPGLSQLRKLVKNVPFVGKLFTCFVCFSHYVAFALAWYALGHISFYTVAIAALLAWGAILTQAYLIRALKEIERDET